MGGTGDTRRRGSRFEEVSRRTPIVSLRHARRANVTNGPGRVIGLDALARSRPGRSSTRRPAPVDVFFRDDDAGWRDDRLLALLDLFAEHALPLDVAVIPAALGEPVAAELRGRAGARLGLHQHGFAHANHEPDGRKHEFGPSRPLRRSAARHRGRRRAARGAARRRRRPDLHAALEPLHRRHRPLPARARLRRALARVPRRAARDRRPARAPGPRRLVPPRRRPRSRSGSPPRSASPARPA